MGRINNPDTPQVLLTRSLSRSPQGRAVSRGRAWVCLWDVAKSDVCNLAEREGLLGPHGPRPCGAAVANAPAFSRTCGTRVEPGHLNIEASNPSVDNRKGPGWGLFDYWRRESPPIRCFIASNAIHIIFKLRLVILLDNAKPSAIIQFNWGTLWGTLHAPHPKKWMKTWRFTNSHRAR